MGNKESASSFLVEFQGSGSHPSTKVETKAAPNPKKQSTNPCFKKSPSLKKKRQKRGRKPLGKWGSQSKEGLSLSVARRL